MERIFDTPIKTNDQSIDRVLAAGLPVLLVFLNGPVPSNLDQALERLAKDAAGKLLVVQVQVKDSPESSRRYQVRVTPVIVAINNSQVQSRTDSVTPKDVESHAAYLLGRGPKPTSAGTSTAPTASGSSPHAQTSHNGYAQNRPQTVTDSTFDRDVLHSPVPVLVDFWAPWCGPCRMTEPTVEKLAREKQGMLRVAKINVDENPRISQQYGIQSIPTMMMVLNGQIVDRWVGALPEPAIRSRVEAALR